MTYQEAQNILSFIFITAQGYQEPGTIPKDRGHKVGKTLDRVSTHHRAHTHTHTGQSRDAEQPTTHLWTGEETYKLSAQRVEVGIEPTTSEV